MNSINPYLIRAFYNWICDNNLTPYIFVNPKLDGVVVPDIYQDKNNVVFNINPQAVNGLDMHNDYIKFSARFDEGTHYISIPIYAVTGIFAKENNQGMLFAADITQDAKDQKISLKLSE